MSNAPITTDLIATYRWATERRSRWNAWNDTRSEQPVNKYLFGTISHEPECRTHLLVPDIANDRLTTACHHGNDISWVHDNWTDEASHADDLCAACERIVRRLIEDESRPRVWYGDRVAHAYYPGPGQGDSSYCGRALFGGIEDDTSTHRCSHCERALR